MGDKAAVEFSSFGVATGSIGEPTQSVAYLLITIMNGDWPRMSVGLSTDRLEQKILASSLIFILISF